jgi:diguanylate cyclase (GGDEF)-like protein
LALTSTTHLALQNEGTEHATVPRSLSISNGVISSGLAVILLSVGAVTLMGAHESALTRTWVRHNSDTLIDTRNIAIAIRDAETGQRGYLLTGDDRYLLPYTLSNQQVAANMASLQTLMADNPLQLLQLAALRPILAKKFAELGLTVELRRLKGLGPAMAVMRSDNGLKLMAQIETALTAMTLTERRLLSDRIEQSDAAARRVSLMASAGTLFAMVALLWGTRRLNRAAKTDRLTGLLNRSRIWDLFNAGLRGGGSRVSALLYVNLDRFRSVNQMFGAQGGDLLLKEVAARLRSLPGADAIGRRGGDDFVFFCNRISATDAEDLGRRTVDLLAQPFDVDGHRMSLTASVGVAHIDAAGDVDLRQGADDAIWVAKNQGGNRSVAFTQSMLSDRRDLAEMEAALRHAIASDTEISLVYQPVVWISDNHVGAVEVLARWAHPRFGQISPGQFIPLAEARGLIVPLGRKLTQMAVLQAKQWRDNPFLRAMVTNINISPVQFASGDVIAEFAAMLTEQGLQTQEFCIEVTEGAFTGAQAIAALEEARRLGFLVTMDDFGVGYSCLAQLPRLPLGSVKLDRSFILGAARDVGEAVMLRSIVDLAHAQNLLVIAEGIETAAQLSLTVKSGCDAVQGYYFARPMSPAALENWLAIRQPSRAVQLEM